MRVGTGFDVHRLVSGRPLILGGISLEYDKGLEGHSDGDALTHAIIDALLGAAGLGDIGVWFPPGDEKFRDANSLQLLETVRKGLAEHEYAIVNIDATVICEQPKLSAHFEKMRQVLAEAMQVSPEQVSVKATTAERLGVIGNGEAIAAQAIALID
jgi:2-C-methyl-D-erythritol 2,4-cyclodiphosphate synthase